MGIYENDLKKGNKQYPGGGSQYFTFEEGDNRIRIISKCEVFGQHYLQGVGYKVCIGRDNECEWCAQEDKPSAYYFVWIIDRKDNIIKEAKLSYTVMKSIDDTTEIKEHIFEPNEDGIFPYDLNVRMIEGKKKKEKRQYNVLPSPVSDLTKEEKEALAKLDTPLVMIEAMKVKAGKVVKTDEGVAGEVNVNDIPF